MTKGAPAEYPDARGTDSAIAAEGDPGALRYRLIAPGQAANTIGTCSEKWRVPATVL